MLLLCSGPLVQCRPFVGSSPGIGFGDSSVQLDYPRSHRSSAFTEE